MMTILRTIRFSFPLPLFFLILSSSCGKEDSNNNNNTNNNNINNNNTNNNNTNISECNNQGTLNYDNCITCVAILSFSNGQPASVESDTMCPGDFSSQAAFRGLIESICSYDGVIEQGSGTTITHDITCRN